MSQTILSDYGWFYIIVQAQTLVLGYGITVRADPVERLLEYTKPVCAPQTFHTLYYGKIRQIRDLENYVKNEWRYYRNENFSDRKLEWLAPKHKINISDLEKLIEKRIVEYPYDTIRRIKRNLMPLTIYKSGFFDSIIVDPNRFLDKPFC
jgi:hypothetical protein